MGDGTTITVADAMSTRPITVAPHLPLDECARLMRRHDVGSVIVGSGPAFVGLVTEQLIVQRVIAKGLEPSSLSVGDVMETDAVTTHPGTELAEAMRLMARHHTRHLPVLDDGKLVGFLTIKDLLAIQPTLIDILTERAQLQEEQL